MLWFSQDQDVIQINNNIKSLALAKKQYRFSKWSETLATIASPNGKSSTDNVYVGKQTVNTNDDAYQWEYVNKHPWDQ